MAFAGSNQDMYPTLQATAVDIGSSTASLAPDGQRVYLNDGTYPNTIPTAWPTLSDPSARACVSIRPSLWELISGNYDAALKNFLTGSNGPPGGATSLLSLWHEASSGGPGGIYETYFDSLDQQFPGMGGASGLLTKGQTYVQQKAQAWNADVKVGAVEVVELGTANQGQLKANLTPWMAKDLDFYAADTYDFKDASASPSDLLNAFLYVGNSLASAPTIGIAETNSRFPGRRPYWFTQAWSWLASHGFTSNTTSFLTYWNTTGIESGAWIPADWATIDALYVIFAKSSP